MKRDNIHSVERIRIETHNHLATLRFAPQTFSFPT